MLITSDTRCYVSQQLQQQDDLVVTNYRRMKPYRRIETVLNLNLVKVKEVKSTPHQEEIHYKPAASVARACLSLNTIKIRTLTCY